MLNLDEYKELIPAYLAGTINDEDRLKLEAALQKYPELRDELEELKEISAGLTLLEEISTGHISPELLAIYAVEPGTLTKDDRKNIEEHIVTCDSCREELIICKESLPGQEPTSQENPLTSFFNWLLFGHATLRPIYGLAVLLIIVAPVVYFSLQQPSELRQATYEIVPSGARALPTENKIEITDDHKIVRFEFVVPVLPNRTYNFELIDPDGHTVLIIPDNKPQKAFAVDIPATYLSTGKYNLIVREFNGRVEQEQFQFPLDIVVLSH